MRINRYFMPITVIAILALSVATDSVMGLWKTLEALYSGLNLNKSIKPSTQVKELEQTLPDFDTDVVRELVEKYQAGEKLQVSSKAKAPAEEKAPAAAVTAEQKPAGERSELTAKSTLDDIRGRMTLKEIGDAFRISVPALISRLGLPAKVDINAPLKDYLEEYGLSITAIRDEVRAMLEK